MQHAIFMVAKISRQQYTPILARLRVNLALISTADKLDRTSRALQEPQKPYVHGCLHVYQLLRGDLDLNRCMTRLHSLRLLQTFVNIRTMSTEVPRLARILSVAAFDELQVIDITFDTCSIRLPINLSLWKGVDNACSVPRLPALRTFAIKIISNDFIPSSSAESEREVARSVSSFKNRLSGIHKRGVLLVKDTRYRGPIYYRTMRDQSPSPSFEEYFEEHSISEVSGTSSIDDETTAEAKCQGDRAFTTRTTA